MRTRVLLFFVLLGILTSKVKSESTEEKAEKGSESEVEVTSDDPSDEEADRNAHYFTQETMKEMKDLEKYMNSKLWACSLISLCKIANEQVLSPITE